MRRAASFAAPVDAKMPKQVAPEPDMRAKPRSGSPASAASVAGLLKLARSGFFRDQDGPVPATGGSAARKKRIVCILTGHGLKDPDNAIKESAKPISVPASADAVLEHVGLLQHV